MLIMKVYLLAAYSINVLKSKDITDNESTTQKS